MGAHSLSIADGEMRVRVVQGKIGYKGGYSACGGWIGMMDDESRACRRRQHTFSRCPLSHRVHSSASVSVTRMGKMPCQGMGSADVAAIWDKELQPQGSRLKQLAYLASPSVQEHLEAVEIHLAQRVNVEATACTAP